MLGFGLGALRNNYAIGPRFDAPARQTEVYDFRAGALPEGVSISRATEAYHFNSSGNLALAGLNVARFDHDPVTQEYLGLLIERDGRNTVLYSEPEVETWKTLNLASDLVETPSLGLLNGTRISSTGVSWGQFRTSCSVEGGIQNIVTLFAQAGQGNKLRMLISSSLGSPLAQGTFGALEVFRQGTNIEIEVLDQILLSDGVTWRIQIGVTPTETTDIKFGIGPNSATVGDDLILLAVQAEAGSASSSYIQTHESPKERAQDYIAFDDLFGVFDLTFEYADERTIVTSGVTIERGVPFEIPAGHLVQISALPS